MCFGSKSPQVNKVTPGSAVPTYDPNMDSKLNPRLKNGPAPTSSTASMISDQAAPTPSATSPML